MALNILQNQRVSFNETGICERLERLTGMMPISMRKAFRVSDPLTPTTRTLGDKEGATIQSSESCSGTTAQTTDEMLYLQT